MIDDSEHIVSVGLSRVFCMAPVLLSELNDESFARV
jgi:hypothetical protein